MSRNRPITLCLISILMLLITMGCSSDKTEKVKIYEMESYSKTKKNSLRIITDLNEIQMINRAFTSANKDLGIVAMAYPRYRVELGNEIYFLWINEDAGRLMNENDTHTTYTLMKHSAKEVTEVITRHFHNTNK